MVTESGLGAALSPDSTFDSPTTMLGLVPCTDAKKLMRLGSRGGIASALSFVSCGPPALPSTCAAYRRFVEPWAKQGYLRRRRAAHEESC